MAKYNPDHVFVVYFDSEGNEHSQSISDLDYSGTLSDPETGGDMEIEWVEIPEEY